MTWYMARQVHIPKVGMISTENQDCKNFRPITILSVWCRVWSGGRLKSVKTQQWLRNWWPKEAIGGGPMCELHDALFCINDQTERDEFLCSLDYSLAFDHTHPKLVTNLLAKLGCMKALLLSWRRFGQTNLDLCSLMMSLVNTPKECPPHSHKVMLGVSLEWFLLWRDPRKISSLKLLESRCALLLMTELLRLKVLKTFCMPVTCGQVGLRNWVFKRMIPKLFSSTKRNGVKANSLVRMFPMILFLIIPKFWAMN